MDIFYSIFLGILQGATEFLPISSSGHLVLAELFLDVKEGDIAFDIALHMGTLCSILVYFREEFSQMAMSIFKAGRINTLEQEIRCGRRQLIWLIFAGSLPAVGAGLLFGDLVEQSMRTPVVVIFTLSFFGLVLLLADNAATLKRHLTSVNLSDAVLIGLAQAVAIIPGVSRSGITITVGLFLGLNRLAATRFSFLLAAPIIFGAGVYHFPDLLHEGFAGDKTLFFLTGFVTSFLSGYFFIAFLLHALKTRPFAIFAYYRFLLAGGALLYLLIAGM